MKGIDTSNGAQSQLNNGNSNSSQHPLCIPDTITKRFLDISYLLFIMAVLMMTSGGQRSASPLS